jgi:hypothetical protein
LATTQNRQKNYFKDTYYFTLLDDRDGKQRPIDDGVREREGVEGLGKVFFFNFVM